MAQVTVTVSGPTGSGKSRVLAEIEIALKAVGVSVRWADVGDRRDVNSEHWADARGSWQPDFPEVILQEINTPVDEFRAKVLALLNSNWPHRSETDEDTADRARALAKQLRNWGTWK